MRKAIAKKASRSPNLNALPEAVNGIKKVHRNGQPRSLYFAAEGVRTGREFAGMMSALMSDVILGRVSPQVANAAVNAGGKLLKIVELQQRYGNAKDGQKVLTLAD